MTRGYHGLLGKTAGDNVGAPECARALGTSAGQTGMGPGTAVSAKAARRKPSLTKDENQQVAGDDGGGLKGPWPWPASLGAQRACLPSRLTPRGGWAMAGHHRPLGLRLVEAGLSLQPLPLSALPRLVSLPAGTSFIPGSRAKGSSLPGQGNESRARCRLRRWQSAGRL